MSSLRSMWSKVLRPSSSVLAPTDHTMENKKRDCTHTCKYSVQDCRYGDVSQVAIT